MAGQSKRKFVCRRGLSWGRDGRFAYEPGEVIEKLPNEYVEWMLAEGTIEEYDGELTDHEVVVEPDEQSEAAERLVTLMGGQR